MIFQFNYIVYSMIVLFFVFNYCVLNKIRIRRQILNLIPPRKLNIFKEFCISCLKNRLCYGIIKCVPP